jgi:ribosomal protein L24E
MCGDCFVFGGGKIGVGTGQLYLNEEGEWLLVGGFPPDEEDDPV